MKEELKKTENGENNGSGSAEKTEKKKISSMEYIVIALSLLGVCLGALGMFGSSIARVLFPTNLGEIGIALILLCCLLRYLRSKKRERDKAGSAEKTGKKKILSPMECIVIALLLLAVCVGALVIFRSSISSAITHLIDPPKRSLDLMATRPTITSHHESYYCNKCQETHSYTIYNSYDKGAISGTWCRKCCMMGAYQSTNPPLIHCCKCKSNHYRGECDVEKCPKCGEEHSRMQGCRW